MDSKHLSRSTFIIVSRTAINGLMEEIENIKKEIQEKSGREWFGILPTSEKHLETFRKYLSHPKLHEKPKIINEMISLYKNAKASSFVKMEALIRKLDQYKIQLGDVSYITNPVMKRKIVMTAEKRAVVLDSDEEIEKMKVRVKNTIESSPGGSLLPKTEKSLKTFSEYLENPELRNQITLVEEMVSKYTAVEASNFTRMQEFDNFLVKMSVKLKSKPTVVGTGQEIAPRSTRGKWAMEGLKKTLGGSTDSLFEVDLALHNMSVTFKTSLEGELYKLSLDEDDPEILNKILEISTPFLRYLSEIGPNEINISLKSSKYFSVIEMFKHVVKQAKEGDAHIFDSKNDFMQYFFPEKEVEEFEDLEPLNVLSDYYDDPLMIPGAQTIFDLWDGIINFGMLIKSTLVDKTEDPICRSIVDTIGRILESLSHGDQMVIYSRALMNAARKKDEEEVASLLKSIIRHVNKDFIDKINNDIMPQLAKAKFGEDIFTFQEESIQKIGIDVSLLKWKKSAGADEGNGLAGDFLDFHRGKEHEMLMVFNTSMEKLRNYLNDKAAEESYSKEITEKKFEHLAKFFNEFEWRWTRGRTKSELPLLNAIGVLIIEKVLEADKYFEELIATLMNITNKNRHSSIKLPITMGMKSNEYSISKPIQKFVRRMEKIKKKLTPLKILNEMLSKLSGYLRLLNVNLPLEYIQNQEYLENPDKFQEHLDQEEKALKANKISLTIYEQEYEEKMNALKEVRKILEENGEFIKFYSKKLVLLREN